MKIYFLSIDSLIMSPTLCNWTEVAKEKSRMTFSHWVWLADHGNLYLFIYSPQNSGCITGEKSAITRVEAILKTNVSKNMWREYWPSIEVDSLFSSYKFYMKKSRRIAENSKKILLKLFFFLVYIGPDLLIQTILLKYTGQIRKMGDLKFYWVRTWNEPELHSV